jgi:hypothetical protein
MYIDRESFDYEKNHKNPKKSALFIFLTILAAILVGFLIQRSFAQLNYSLENSTPAVMIISSKIEKEKETQKQKSLQLPIYSYKPVSISMREMKKQGCVADGLLSGYGDDTQEAVNMINHSECRYLHRALETWAMPPDFGQATRIMQQIKSNKLIYGMFLSEALKTNAIYYYPGEERFFDFKTMCRDGSENAWGEHTCKPSFSSSEYRKYLKYITRRAMDIGIQSFLFGQVYYQDSANLKDSRLEDVISEMRDYAKKKNMDIAIGGQTGAITDKDYLHLFDYLEGGVGIGEDGEIEMGACWSRMESCWALLWNKAYSRKAKNVFLHLDWSGLKFDDMDVFARMDAGKRAEVLKKLYKYFTSNNFGFMMPLMGTISPDNGGCSGPSAGFYSASREYSCKDESVINLILKGN